MSYNAESFTRLADLKLLAQRTSAELEKVSSTAGDGIKYIAVSGNTVNFYKSSDGTGTPAFTVDFPRELFLDGTRTNFVSNFTFAASTYPGAVNPSLDGKPVLVLAVKGTTDSTNGTASDTITYSFLDMSTLVDTYKAKVGASSQILNISGYEIEVKFDTTLTATASDLGVAISAAANNAITKQSDGLHVDMSGKVDKVADATQGNVVVFASDGSIADSEVGIATTAETTEMLNEVFGTPAASGD